MSRVRRIFPGGHYLMFALPFPLPALCFALHSAAPFFDAVALNDTLTKLVIAGFGQTANDDAAEDDGAVEAAAAGGTAEAALAAALYRNTRLRSLSLKTDCARASMLLFVALAGAPAAASIGLVELDLDVRLDSESAAGALGAVLRRFPALQRLSLSGYYAAAGADGGNFATSVCDALHGSNGGEGLPPLRHLRMVRFGFLDDSGAVHLDL